MNEESVLTDFFELISFITQVATVLILGENSSSSIGFFGEDVADMGIVDFIVFPDSMFFCAAALLWVK